MLDLPKTNLLYLQDSYIRELATAVLNVSKNAVELNETIFYPEGGGQPTDTGRLDCQSGTAIVTHVVKQGDRILHYLEDRMPRLNEEVFLRLDWNRRYAHMRMHTAQHIVSRIVFEQFGSYTVGNQIRDQYSHIDFAPATFQSSDLSSIETAANDIIKQNLPIKIEVIPRHALEERMGSDRSNLAKLPSSVRQVRLVQIGNYDAYPCAGTHVKSTAELKGLRITKRKSKGKETIRISYELTDEI